jgi:hypothetical protein
LAMCQRFRGAPIRLYRSSASFGISAGASLLDDGTLCLA